MYKSAGIKKAHKVVKKVVKKTTPKYEDFVALRTWADNNLSETYDLDEETNAIFLSDYEDGCNSELRIYLNHPDQLPYCCGVSEIGGFNIENEMKVPEDILIDTILELIGQRVDEARDQIGY